ncbi:MAG: hypothetical protein MUW56_05310 [Chryseobacterium sp.]|uniref:hypothetical protein n=1 Tax=Chryseobacterium sp. TaxID=1871047 RepID=UPI0025C407CC|nr:hypothetical protein [Chryseobacterium sp.]MCJ7933053.1 hypothetical protein [Chryseobacterium sp.]
MKNIYRNYNEEDLIVAYLSLIDHTGTINNEMDEAIRQNFNYDDFVKKAEYRRAFIKEKGRISFEVHQMVRKGLDHNFILDNTSSEIMEDKELKKFILQKFSEFSAVKENNTIDKDTIYRSLLGILISSVTGFLFLGVFAFIMNTFLFALLVPVYIINYFVIRFVTGKTRDNLIVFLAVFISVIISTLLPFILIRQV